MQHDKQIYIKCIVVIFVKNVYKCYNDKATIYVYLFPVSCATLKDPK